MFEHTIHGTLDVLHSRRAMSDKGTHVLGASQSNSGNALNPLQTKLSNGLAGLLLVAGVDNGLRSTGASLASLNLGVGAVGAIVLSGDLLLGGLLVGELFDAWVRHDGLYVCGRVRGLAISNFESGGDFVSEKLYVAAAHRSPQQNWQKSNGPSYTKWKLSVESEMQSIY